MNRLTTFLLASAIAAGPALYLAPASAAPQPAPAVRAATPVWFANGSPAAARQLVQLIATAKVEGLNPKTYNINGLSRAVEAAASGNPAAQDQAQRMLDDALVAYVRDSRHDPNIGIIYVDKELKPAPPSPAQILADAAAAPALADYVAQLGWMSPIYGKLRQALASRVYRNSNEERLLRINMERARALPAGGHRYIIVNAAAQRLYMYEDGQVVDSMRVVAGRPDPIAQTPMMNAFIRYTALNPYWNSPADITARRLAPNVLKQGRSYFKAKGYEVLSDWTANAHVIDPMSIDWHAVAAGTLQARMRQKPGPANSMGKMKFMFPNAQGIWLHDTPEQEKIDDAARLQSNGCVRLEDAARLARWMYGRPLAAKGAAPEQKVPLPQLMPIYLTYLTAVPSGTQIVYFDDFYGRDRMAMRRG